MFTDCITACFRAHAQFKVCVLESTSVCPQYMKIVKSKYTRYDYVELACRTTTTVLGITLDWIGIMLKSFWRANATVPSWSGSLPKALTLFPLSAMIEWNTAKLRRRAKAWASLSPTISIRPYKT